MARERATSFTLSIYLERRTNKMGFLLVEAKQIERVLPYYYPTLFIDHPPFKIQKGLYLMSNQTVDLIFIFEKPYSLMSNYKRN